jgi:RHS repeat-associated protein
MIIRKQQFDALAKVRGAYVRQEHLRRFREKGLKAEQDSSTGHILLQDAAGGRASVSLEQQSVLISSGEDRSFKFEHDARGRVRTVTDPDGFPFVFQRDAKGRLASIERGSALDYRFDYDAKSRISSLRYPDESTVQYRYDSVDRIIDVLDRNGNHTLYRYSDTGELTSTADAAGNETRFEYFEGLPSAIIQADGSRQEVELDAKSGTWKVSSNGLQRSAFRFASKTGTFEAEYADGTSARFVLKDNRIVQALNETCAVNLTYDGEGRITSEETEGKVVRYLRNEVGALVGLITPEGAKITFERDSEHRVRKIVDWLGGTYELEYQERGTLGSIRYPNGALLQMASTRIGFPESVNVTSKRYGQAAVSSCRWFYDKCDRATQMVTDGGSYLYSYDPEGRLSGASGETFALDPNGNRSQDATGACRYNQLNQLVQRGSQNYTYDFQGNIESGACPRGVAEYSYNGRNQMTAVRCAGTQARYVYDAFGRRLRKEVGSRVTRYTWAGQQLLSEETKEHGRVVAQRDYLSFPEASFPLAMRANGELFYIHAAWRAAPMCMTAANGSVVWKAEYTPFGEARVVVNLVPQPWRLAGQYCDDETGLHYTIARYYDPQIGRFLSMDPMRDEGGSLNFYLYCDGDPINRVDPTGAFIFVAILVGIAIGAAIGAGIEWWRQKQAINAGTQKDFDGWGFAKATAVGGFIGGIGGGVAAAVEGAFALGAGASLAATGGVGALSGMASSAVEQCAEGAITGHAPSAEDLIKGVFLGGIIGAATAGIGGAFARRARRLAQEAERRAFQEAEENAARALREAEEAEQRTQQAARKSRKDLNKLSAKGDKYATYELNRRKIEHAELNGRPENAVGPRAENRVADYHGDDLQKAGEQVNTSQGPYEIDAETKKHIYEVKGGKNLPDDEQASKLKEVASERRKEPSVYYDSAQVSQTKIDGFESRHPEIKLKRLP